MIFAIAIIWQFAIKPILIFNINFAPVYILLIVFYGIYLKVKKKKPKPNIMVKKMIKPPVVVLLLTNMLFLWWFNHPYIGYSREYKQSGNAMSPSEVYICGNHLKGNYPMTTSPCELETGGYPTQKDYELQKRNITKMYNLKYPLEEKSDIGVKLSIDEQDIDKDFSDLPYEVKISGGGGEVANYSNKEYVELNYDDFSEELSFKSVENIENINMFSLIEEGKPYFNIDWDGIENIDKISFAIIEKGYYTEYTYDMDNELGLFMHDFGYLDKDGYYGEIYDKPDEVLKESESIENLRG